MTPEEVQERIRALQERQESVRVDFERAQQEEETIRKRRVAKGDELYSIQKRLAEARQHAGNGNGSGPTEVSDHAVVQYLALCKGVAVESLRREILTQLRKAQENIINLSTSTFLVDGKRFVVRDGKVVSILKD